MRRSMMGWSRAAAAAADRSGEIATWTDRCPLEGTCPECGLTLPWVDVLRAERNLCRGFIEHVPRRVPWCSRVRHVLRWFAAAWRTWFWTLLPWRLWSRVKVWQPVSVFRAALGFVIIMGTLHALNALLMLVQYFTLPQVGGSMWQTYAQRNALLECAFGPFTHADVSFRGLLSLGGWGYYSDVSLGTFLVALFFVPACLACGVPALFGMLPNTRWTVPIRTAHLARCTLYALAPIALAWIVFAIDEARIVRWNITHGFLPSPRLYGRYAPNYASWPRERFLKIFQIYPAIFSMLLIWHAIYWTAVLRSWGIRRPALHAILLLIPIALVLVILALMFWRDRWFIDILT